MYNLDAEVIKEFKSTMAYGKIEEKLLQDKALAMIKLKTVSCYEPAKIAELQAKVKYIDFLLRLVDSNKNK